METIIINVTHYFPYSHLFPFMDQDLYEILENATENNLTRVRVPKDDFNHMIELYFDTLKN